MTKSLTLTPDLLATLIRDDPRLKSPHSQKQYTSALQAFEAWRAGRQMTKTLVEAYAAYLQAQDLAPDTINQRLAVVRWWARKVIDLAHDYMTPEQARPVIEQAARVGTVRNVTGSRQQRGRHLDDSELKDLLTACKEDGPAGLRDTAIIALAWTTGLRQAEIRALTLDDIEHDPEAQAATLHIRGKGDKYRPAYLYNGAYQAMQNWLKARGQQPGPVFCPISKSGKPAPARSLSHEGLRKILGKRITQAGIDPLTPHDFRRTLAGNLLDKNDLATVQSVLGHASPTTTSAYDRRPDARKRAAIQQIIIPEV